MEINDRTDFDIPDIPKHMVEEVKMIDVKELLNRVEAWASQYKSNFSKAAAKGPIKSLSKPFLERVQYTLYKIKYLKKVSKLQEGASFGELAMLMKQPRAATIKAVRKTLFATLTKEQFDGILFKVHQEQINKKLDILEEIPYLCEYSKSFKTKITCKALI